MVVAQGQYADVYRARPLRLGEEFQTVYGESAGSRKANFRLGHPDPPADPTAAPWRFRASDTDMAGHVNNAAYWQPLEEELLEGSDPERIDAEIEYRTPAQPGEVRIVRNGSRRWIVGSDGETLASILLAHR